MSHNNRSCQRPRKACWRAWLSQRYTAHQDANAKTGTCIRLVAVSRQSQWPSFGPLMIHLSGLVLMADFAPLIFRSYDPFDSGIGQTGLQTAQALRPYSGPDSLDGILLRPNQSMCTHHPLSHVHWWPSFAPLGGFLVGTVAGSTGPGLLTLADAQSPNFSGLSPSRSWPWPCVAALGAGI